MMIREKAAGNAALSSFIIPANIDSKLIQSLLPLATKAKKLVGLVRVPEVIEDF